MANATDIHDTKEPRLNNTSIVGSSPSCLTHDVVDLCSLHPAPIAGTDGNLQSRLITIAWDVLRGKRARNPCIYQAVGSKWQILPDAMGK